MGLWKYDTIVGGWHFENGTDYKGSNDITLTGTTTVAGKLNNAQSFVTNDYGTSNGLITSLAGVNKGTIAGWVNLDADNGADQIIMSMSIGNGVDTRFILRARWFGADNFLDMYYAIGGVAQWYCHTPVDSLTTSYLEYVISHDETEISEIILNGSPVTVNYTISTDKTKWFGDLITAGADTFSWGSQIISATRSGYLNGDLDETMINSELWEATDKTAFWNDGAGQEITDPNLVSGLTTRFAG